MPVLTALPTSLDHWNALLTRDDVVLERGMLHLVAPHTTAYQARIDDLLLVAETLESAGIPVVLIRHDRRSPALVIDDARRIDAIEALHSLADREPLYAKAKGSPALPFADAASSCAGASGIRVFRPRLVRSGGLRYGAAEGVRLEFWRTTDAEVHAPVANSLTRRITPAEDLTFTTVERYGRTWRTIAGMFEPQPDEFVDDVDLVFSWVDGSSTEFQRQRAAQLAEYVVGDGDDGPARFRHIDELRYALRSVHMYAPWVRRIFIATDSPAPAWLIDHPRVTIVRSEEFFRDTTTLPTHNSHAVEAQLHHIDGLAEHFLYSNDDMFFARPVEPELFFSAAGLTKFVECDIRIGAGPSRLHRSGHDNALRVNRELIHERFGRMITHDLEHCATPLRRSVLSELEQSFADDFART
ncbi:MAG: sugar phosphotransferase, partial [Actinobacteria bacterium]|nr:sugar phosphotransferase [Actinomycetota bacterium]